MEAQFETILSVGIILLLLAILWAWTTIKTKSMDGQVKTAITGQKTERYITLAKIQQEGLQQNNSTKETIAILQDKTSLRRIEADKYYHDKQILLGAKSLDVQLDRETIQQNALNSRAQLKCQTKSEIAGMELSYRNRELNSRVEMSQDSLNYRTRKLEEDVQLRKMDLGVQREAITANERSHRYVADKAFEGIALSQRHEDERHFGLLDAQKTMHQGSLELRRTLGMTAIESNERVQLDGHNCRRYEAQQATVRTQIEGENQGNMFNTLLGTVVNVAARGLLPIGGAGRRDRTQPSLPPGRLDPASRSIPSIRKP